MPRLPRMSLWVTVADHCAHLMLWLCGTNEAIIPYVQLQHMQRCSDPLSLSLCLSMETMLTIPVLKWPRLMARQGLVATAAGSPLPRAL